MPTEVEDRTIEFDCSAQASWLCAALQDHAKVAQFQTDTNTGRSGTQDQNRDLNRHGGVSGFVLLGRPE
jgi:hypothetical protein